MEDSKEKNGGLLEFLAFNSGCMYLSDLRQPKLLAKVRGVLPRINPVLYSIWEWNDAVFYITGIQKNFSTQEAALAYLDAYLAG